VPEPQTPSEIVAHVRASYSEDIFGPPTPGCAVDRYSAAGARLACDAIARELHEREAEAGHARVYERADGLVSDCGRYRSTDPLLLFAYRCFGAEERAMQREAQAQRAVCEAARIAHERAEEALSKAEKAGHDRRDWWARNALRALGLPAPDMSFDEMFAYQDDDEVVIVVRRKKVP